MTAVMPPFQGSQGPRAAPRNAGDHVTDRTNDRTTDRASKRPSKALPPRKAGHAAECQQLEQLPNIGPSIAADLRLIGIAHPQALATQDAFQLYQALCRATGKRHDPCVLDTFMAACDFMRGAAAKPWWDYTTQRKAQYGAV